MKWISVVWTIGIAGTAWAAPEDRGPHPVATWDAGDVAVAGTTLPTKVYYPEDVATPAPLVAVIHGFLRTGEFHVELASTLASRGFVTVVPDMPCRLDGFTVDCDHDANAVQIEALLDWAAAQSADGASPLSGRVDGETRGVIGHSWGGLAVFLAGARSTALDSVVTLDPNDDGGVGEAQAASMGAPYAELRAEVPGSCNADWTDAAFEGVPPPKLGLVVAGAGHCDAEEPGDGACPVLCGEGDPALSRVFRRYAVAWTACILEGDAEVAPWIGGESFDADVSTGVVTNTDAQNLDTLPCYGTGDADTDSDTDADTDSDTEPTSSRKDEGGCGCRLASPVDVHVDVLVLVLVVASQSRSRARARQRARRRPPATA